eukprot:6213255-Pleurochrysis_carterae.AAC.5
MLALLLVLGAVHSAGASTKCVETGHKANYSSFCALTSDRNHPRQLVRHMGRFASRQQSRQPPMRLLPSLILIGSIKAGTTTLWSALVDSRQAPARLAVLSSRRISMPHEPLL